MCVSLMTGCGLGDSLEQCTVPDQAPAVVLRLTEALERPGEIYPSLVYIHLKLIHHTEPDSLKMLLIDRVSQYTSMLVSLCFSLLTLLLAHILTY